jgi:hypothetical protein
MLLSQTHYHIAFPVPLSAHHLPDEQTTVMEQDIHRGRTTVRTCTHSRWKNESQQSWQR